MEVRTKGNTNFELKEETKKQSKTQTESRKVKEQKKVRNIETKNESKSR